MEVPEGAGRKREKVKQAEWRESGAMGMEANQRHTPGEGAAATQLPQLCSAGCCAGTAGFMILREIQTLM